MAYLKYTTFCTNEDCEAPVEGTVTPGYPESGRFGPPENYDPGSGDEVEIPDVCHSCGRTWTKEERSVIEDRLIEKLQEDDSPGMDPDAIMEARREAARDDDWD